MLRQQQRQHAALFSSQTAAATASTPTHTTSKTATPAASAPSKPSKKGGKGKSDSDDAASARLALASGESSASNTPSNVAVLRQLLRYLWPAGEPGLRARVVASLGLMIGAKVCSVYVPVLFKEVGQFRGADSRSARTQEVHAP